MKILLMITASMFFVNLSNGQRGAALPDDEPHYSERSEGSEDGFRMEEYSPEQRATLKTKEMAVYLDLNQAQQDKLLRLNLKYAEKREVQRKQMQEKSQLTDQQRYELRNQKLDSRLTYQNELKQILTENQYASWKEEQQYRKERHQERKRH